MKTKKQLISEIRNNISYSKNSANDKHREGLFFLAANYYYRSYGLEIALDYVEGIRMKNKTQDVAKCLSSILGHIEGCQKNMKKYVEEEDYYAAAALKARIEGLKIALFNVEVFSKS